MALTGSRLRRSACRLPSSQRQARITSMPNTRTVNGRMPTLSRWSSMKQSLRGQVFKNFLRATITTRPWRWHKKEMDPKAYMKRRNKWISQVQWLIVHLLEVKTKRQACHNHVASLTTAKLLPMQLVNREDRTVTKWPRAVTPRQTTTKSSQILLTFQTMLDHSRIHRAIVQLQTRQYNFDLVLTRCQTASSTKFQIWVLVGHRLHISIVPIIAALRRISQARQLPLFTLSTSIKTASAGNLN